jgi:hypothetical protein
MAKRTQKAPLTDDVLICEKLRIKGGFRVWAKDAPTIVAEADTLDRAEDLIVDQMWDRYDLDEPFGLKYENSTEPSSTSPLFIVSPNEVTDSKDPARYFTGGFCTTCQSGQGRRNSEILEIEHIPKRVRSGLIVRFQPYFKCGMRVGMRLFHRDICVQLQRLNPPVEFRDVMLRNRGVCEFKEVISKKVFGDKVPVHRKGRIGGRCVTCGATFIYAKVHREHSGVFIDAAAAMRIRRQNVAVVGFHSSPSVCLTTEAWNSIASLPAAKGLLADPLNILSKAEVMREPKLERLRAFKI